jgi:hypothetical protein
MDPDRELDHEQSANKSEEEALQDPDEEGCLRIY